VDDGSRGETARALHELSRADERVRGLLLSRNFRGKNCHYRRTRLRPRFLAEAVFLLSHAVVDFDKADAGAAVTSCEQRGVKARRQAHDDTSFEIVGRSKTGRR
jgi:hypothetical protein